jgi:hypothetical protein
MLALRESFALLCMWGKVTTFSLKSVWGTLPHPQQRHGVRYTEQAMGWYRTAGWKRMWHLSFQNYIRLALISTVLLARSVEVQWGRTSLE